MSARPSKRKPSASSKKGASKSRSTKRGKPAVEPESETDAGAQADAGAEGEPKPKSATKQQQDDRNWNDRSAAVSAMIDELHSHPSAQRVRAIAESLLVYSEDPKWEVRLLVARALAYLEHPDYAVIAARLDTDDNSFVAKAARGSAAKRRELDFAYQAKTDEIDEVTIELRKLREAYGERVASAAERIADQKYRLLTNETTHEMRTVVASLLDALTKLHASLEQSNTSKNVYERTLRIARERTNFLQLMLDDTKRLVDEPKLECEGVPVVAMLEKVAEIVRDALDIPPGVSFEVEAGIPSTTSVHAPRVRLLQAMSSLAKNAIEAVEGEGRVTLSATIPRRGWVRLSVEDNGYGMGPEEIRQALLPMVSSKKDDKHTGVGLPLAKKIIERECHGTFEIESTPDAGTSVICMFPTIED
ncbi:sensor histidine kinase [Enhygromyxa salina]|uniref:histidine kinase n=1 Tax=Enhygromyxa salina TaxID=215803 RepID=A0A2S9YM33_9BACT|nr:HAMP domain-containing sensor histidine kinase [Enhygromyxa salina]PRQ06153.1 Cell-division control histidine kinase PdhS [Enhygromyxa salina]